MLGQKLWWLWLLLLYKLWLLGEELRCLGKLWFFVLVKDRLWD